MSWVIIHFRMFLRMMQWSNHCVLWQIFLVVVFVWAPAPFVCLVCCFSWRNASLAGGFAGRLAGLCVVVVVVPAFPDRFGPCTKWRFTAYAHVRTEPQCDIGQTRGKKTDRKIWGGVVCLLQRTSLSSQLRADKQALSQNGYGLKSVQ